MRPINSYFT